MKKFKKIFYLLFAIAGLLLTACDKNDDGLTYLEEVNFEGMPQASTSSIVLTQEMQDQPALVISWSKVIFPIEEAPVDYTLQFDVPADTLGETAWENATSVPVGSNVLSKEMSVTDLNDMVKDLGLEADEEGTIVYRVRAYVDRPVFSEAGSLQVTPYNQMAGNAVLYVPGAYQGWDPATAATLKETTTPGVFEGIISFTDPAALEFKFTTAPDWSENYGGDGNGNLIFDGNNLSVPSTGSYRITVNMNTMTWMAEPYSFGIIGPATPGGWDSDTDMTYNYQEGYWEYTGELSAGALKFRLNDAWTVNYGSQNSTDFIAYLDDPGAHTIDAAGNYHITFLIDPEDSTMAYYTVEPL
ncbi:SusF/SusE family outer membrane protein [Zunongwangia sp. F363]|uniref:SusF/SusE family outer membrane protein n=1 Tax=Autumnicola tepida TaxID=3075595 RepID=A0ABU3C4J5_9FLAO|nr:SusF/SusE family outer membrane protein [Zunongwangia sp. F363]MDT0641246.1 SusF/SusE family outer membrane protein [Zunongwangia sp. F363]